MGAVGADRELQLEKELGRRVVRQVVVSAPQLGPELRELAGPERQEAGDPAVFQAGVVGMLGLLVAGADEPALGELIVAGDESAPGRGSAPELLAAAAEQLAAEGERTVGGGLERL